MANFGVIFPSSINSSGFVSIIYQINHICLLPSEIAELRNLIGVLGSKLASDSLFLFLLVLNDETNDSSSSSGMVGVRSLFM